MSAAVTPLTHCAQCGATEKADQTPLDLCACKVAAYCSDNCKALLQPRHESNCRMLIASEQRIAAKEQRMAATMKEYESKKLALIAKIAVLADLTAKRKAGTLNDADLAQAVQEFLVAHPELITKE